MAVTTINGVQTLQIRNAKNGDFDLNLSGGGSSEEMMEIWLTKSMSRNEETVTLTDFDDKGITLNSQSNGFNVKVHFEETVTLTDFDDKGITLNSQSNGFNVKVHFNDFGYEYELVCGGYALDTDLYGYLFYVPLMRWGSVKIEFGQSTSATLISEDRISLKISGENTFGANSVSYSDYYYYRIQNISAGRIKGDTANYHSTFNTPLVAFFGVDLNNLLIINTDAQAYTNSDGLAIGYLSNQTD